MIRTFLIAALLAFAAWPHVDSFAGALASVIRFPVRFIGV
jgi:hypothetical protein